RARAPDASSRRTSRGASAGRPERGGPLSLLYLKRSSKALRALETPGELSLAAVGELVCRSTRVRGEKSVHMLRSSFAATRAASFAFSVHSHRALVSNDTHWMQACRSTPHLVHRLVSSTGSGSSVPHRSQRNTSRDAIRFGVRGPAASCSGRPPGARSFGGGGLRSPRGCRSRSSS